MHARRLASILVSAALVAMMFSTGSPAAVRAAGDTTPPTGAAVLYDISARTQVFKLQLTFADPESGIDRVEIWCDSLPHATYAMTEFIVIPFFDTSKGGCETDGQHYIGVQAYNGDGLATYDAENVTLGYVVEIQVSASPTTGKAITFTPIYPAAYTLPADAYCQWEVRWGNNAAILENDFNATFGSLTVSGKAADGFCGPWTFTLPWVPVPHFQVSFDLDSDIDEIGGDSVGFRKDGSDIIRAAVGSTERRITASNLPVMMVLPDVYIATVGEPVTYRLYPVGGAQWDANDGWIAAFQAGEHLFTKDGGRTFTFTPDRVGDWVVFWNAQGKEPYQLSAGYDPPAKRADTIRPTTTTPLTRLAGGTVGSRIPVTVSWTGRDSGWGIDHYKVQQSVDGGAWGASRITRTRSMTATLAPGHTYRFRVRAYDKAGNVGSWDVGPIRRVKAVQETAAILQWTGPWTTAADPEAWGGTSRRSDAAGTVVRHTFTGRGLAWVAGRDPAFGTAKVYLDGSLVATVDLGAASADHRRIVWRRNWTTSTEHRVRIVVVGDAGTPTVDVDGFVVLR